MNRQKRFKGVDVSECLLKHPQLYTIITIIELIPQWYPLYFNIGCAVTVKRSPFYLFVSLFTSLNIYVNAKLRFLVGPNKQFPEHFVVTVCELTKFY